MPHNLTPEEIQLATYKLALENNALLNSIVNELSRIERIMDINNPRPLIDLYSDESRQVLEERIRGIAHMYRTIQAKRVSEFSKRPDIALDFEVKTPS